MKYGFYERNKPLTLICSTQNFTYQIFITTKKKKCATKKLDKVRCMQLQLPNYISRYKKLSDN